MRSSLTVKKKTRGGFGCLALFALPFAAVGAGALYMAVSLLFDWYRMQWWQPVPATITSADLHESSDSDGGSTYRIKATYSYSYNDQTYHGDRVDTSIGSDNIGSYHKDMYRLLEDHRRSKSPYTAYVNPENPHEAILVRDLRFAYLVFISLFAVMFGAVGFGLLGALVYGVITSRREVELESKYPDQPWLHRNDWRSRRVVNGTKTVVIVSSIVALFVGGISAPILYFIPGEVIHRGNNYALFALIFPALGALAILWALRSAYRWRRFRDSYLELHSLPYRLGEKMTGTIHLVSGIPTQPNLVKLTAKCHRTHRTQSGGETTISNSTAWERSVQATPARAGAGRVSIPVEFELPNNGFETGSKGSDTIRWTVSAEADIPGADLWVEFDVPVFASEEVRKESKGRGDL